MPWNFLGWNLEKIRSKGVAKHQQSSASCITFNLGSLYCTWVQHNNCAIENFNVVSHYFLCMFRVSMFAAMQLLQEEPPCDVNVIATKELASLAPNGITTNWSYFVPIINVVEEVANFGEFDSVNEEKKSILKLETHTMPPLGVINKGHLVHELLPIHA